MQQDKDEVKVAVPITDLWKVVSRDFCDILPKIFIGFVEKVELIEGDGGPGSIYFYKFGPAVPKVKYQKEKVVMRDESLHQIDVEVVEGGHLDHGFSSYMTSLKLTEVAKAETHVDITVLYETQSEEITQMPQDTIKGSLHYLKCLENHLSNRLS